MLHSQESGSSVFFHSQEEGSAADPWVCGKDLESGFPSQQTPELLDIGGDLGSESDLETGEFPFSQLLGHFQLLLEVKMCLPFRFSFIPMFCTAFHSANSSIINF